MRRRVIGYPSDFGLTTAGELRNGADTSQTRPWLPGFALAMLACASLRAVMLVITRPLSFPDTPGYIHLANLIRSGQLADGLGQRTPGYSAFLPNVLDRDAVRVTQYALGMAMAAGVFYALWQLTDSQWLASLGALVFGLNVGEVFFESALLTEALSTTLLVAILVLLIWIRSDETHAPLGLVLLGVTVGILPLVRPLYVYMPLLLAAPVISTLGARRRQFWLYLLPAILPVVLWMGYLGRPRLLRTPDGVGLRMDQPCGCVHARRPRSLRDD